MLRTKLRRAARVALALILLVSLAGTAGARGSRGLRWPGASVVEADDASALSHNVAGLGFLDGVDARFVHTDLSVLSGAGDGLFLATHVLGPLSIGAAFEFLPDPVAGERVFRFSFGSALSYGRTFSVGWNVHRMVSDDDPGLDGLLSLDLGAMVRPLSWLALGLHVTDVNTPVLDGSALKRGYEIGVGVRPGTDRVYLGAELRVEERSWDLDVAARMRFEPYPGLYVGGELGVAPRDDRTHLFVGAHLGFSLGYFGMTGGAFFRGVDDLGYDGFTVGIRGSSKRHRSLIRRSGQAVVITLAGEPPERPSGGLLTTRRATFFELVQALDSIRSDSRVDALVIKLRGFRAGWAQVQELRDVLADLRAAGKKVLVHVIAPDTREYYLATESDRLLVHPGGGLFLTGLSMTLTYLRTALEELGVEAQFVAIGRYKSFPEMLTRAGPSVPAAEARDRILNELYRQLVEGMAQGRGLDVAAMGQKVDAGPWGAAQAAGAGLVDGQAFDDELKEQIEELVGHPVALRDDWFAGRQLDTRWGPEEHVAVINIEGSIVHGESWKLPFLGQTFTGDETVVRALGAASRSGKVLGILVRVNSPGGSSIASERMHRAIGRAAERKPLVVSFGDVAASGGYYAGCAAPTILAEPGTITGSIGIWTGKLVFTELLEKLGVHREVLQRGAHAAILSMDRPWTAAERDLVRDRLQELYDLFVQRVAEGRGRLVEEIEPVAQGRVWLGSDALAHGLVDELGGAREALGKLNEALGRHAARYLPLRHYPKQTLLSRLGLGATAAAPGSAPEPEDPPPTIALPAPLEAAARALAPLLGGFGALEPMALLPVHYELR